MRSRILLVPLAAALAAASGLVSSQAVGDITSSELTASIEVVDARVVANHRGCRDVPLAGHYYSSAGVKQIDFTIEVWRGSSKSGSALLDGGYGAISGEVDGFYQHCNYEGLGRFRVGPTDVTWLDGAYYPHSMSLPQTRYFDVRQGSRLENVGAGRKGKTRIFVATAKYFDVRMSTWSRMPRGAKVSLERRASTHAPWHLVKTSRVGKKGAVRISTKSSRKAQYRLTLKDSSHTWGSSTSSMRR